MTYRKDYGKGYSEPRGDSGAPAPGARRPSSGTRTSPRRGANSGASAAAPPPKPPDAGPRPISARQQAFLENRLTGADILEQAVPRRSVSAPAVPPAGARRRHVRDGATSSVVVRKGRGGAQARARANRRSVNYLGICLRLAVVGLIVEAGIVLLFSSRFNVTKTTVEGNATVPTDRIISLLHLGPHENIVRLPVGKLRNAILADPRIDSATIHRSLPGTVHVVLAERKPWASVCLPGNDCYTIDSKFVPFRSSPDPEPGLPRLKLALPAVAEGAAPTPVKLGTRLVLPGFEAVDQCLKWADSERLPVDSIEIADGGKLCLNEKGGMQIQLGSSMNLDRKLAAMSTLLLRKPELRDQVAASSIAYVNLFDVDAPAVMTRAALAAVNKTKAADAAALAKKQGQGQGQMMDDNAPVPTPVPTPDAPAMTVQETVPGQTVGQTVPADSTSPTIKPATKAAKAPSTLPATTPQ